MNPLCLLTVIVTAFITGLVDHYVDPLYASFISGAVIGLGCAITYFIGKAEGRSTE